jgi:hypothetical protein
MYQFCGSERMVADPEVTQEIDLPWNYFRLGGDT